MKCIHVQITEITTKIVSVPVDDTLSDDAACKYACDKAESMLLADYIDMTINVECDRTFNAIAVE